MAPRTSQQLQETRYQHLGALKIKVAILGGVEGYCYTRMQRRTWQHLLSFIPADDDDLQVIMVDEKRSVPASASCQD